MIKDITGAVLVPGDLGQDCPGNGKTPEIECCCEECDYFLCCFDGTYPACCQKCTDSNCPRAQESICVFIPFGE